MTSGSSNPSYRMRRPAPGEVEQRVEAMVGESRDDPGPIGVRHRDRVHRRDGISVEEAAQPRCSFGRVGHETAAGSDPWESRQATARVTRLAACCREISRAGRKRPDAPPCTTPSRRARRRRR
jgi:hypothetical protein